MFILWIVALITHTVKSQINYDSFPLHFARWRMEEKLSTNLFLANIVLDQEEDPESCTAEQGPFCKFVNKKTLNHNERTTEDDYYHTLKNKTLPKFKSVIRSARKQLEQRGGFPGLKAGSALIFYPNGRGRLDQSLYPNHYPAVHTFTFTFQSFKPTVGKLRQFDDEISFKLEPMMFVHEQVQKLKNLKLGVGLKGMYLQKAEAILKKKQQKPRTSRFSFLESDSEREKIMFGPYMPEENYALTLKDKAGFFKLSKPVFFRFVFLRKGSSQTLNSSKVVSEQEVESDQLNFVPKQELGESHYIVGRLNGTEIFRTNFQLDNAEWKRIYFPHKYMVDEIEISPNTQIDNMEFQFNYTHFEQNLKKEEIVQLVTDSLKLKKDKGIHETEDLIKTLMQSLGVEEGKETDQTLMLTELTKDGKVRVLKGKEAKAKLRKMIGQLKDVENDVLNMPNIDESLINEDPPKDLFKDDILSDIQKDLVKTNLDTLKKIEDSFNKNMKDKTPDEIQKMLNDFSETMMEQLKSDQGKQSPQQKAKIDAKMNDMMNQILGESNYQEIQKNFEESTKGVIQDLESMVQKDLDSGKDANEIYQEYVQTMDGNQEEIKDLIKDSIKKKKKKGIKLTEDEAKVLDEFNIDLLKDAQKPDQKKEPEDILPKIKDPKQKEEMIKKIQEWATQNEEVQQKEDEIEKMKEQLRQLKKKAKKMKKSKTKKNEGSKIGETLSPDTTEPILTYSEPIIEYAEPINAEQQSINQDEKILKISDKPASEKELELAEELDNLKDEITNNDDLDEDTKKLIKDAFEESEDDKKLDNILGNDKPIKEEKIDSEFVDIDDDESDYDEDEDY